MLNAIHIIGLEVGDLGGLMLGKGDAAAIARRARAQYEAIIESGELRPAAPHHDKGSRFYPADVLAGDNRFVFLSLGPRYGFDGKAAAATYGFVFDAEQLLRQGGAILRRGDLMGKYDDLLGDVARDIAGWSDPSEWSPEQIAKLMAALEDPDSTDADAPSPNDAYYNLMKAVEQSDTTHPHYERAVAEFRRRVGPLQARRQLTGEAAIAAARADGGSGNCEILVPGSLPLARAVAHVVESHEVVV